MKCALGFLAALTLGLPAGAVERLILPAAHHDFALESTRGRLAAIDRAGSRLRWIDPEAGPTASAPTCHRPSAIAVVAGDAIVGCADGTLERHRRPGSIGDPLARLGRSILGLAAAADGDDVFVLIAGSGDRLWRVGLADGSTTPIRARAHGDDVSLSADGGTLFVSAADGRSSAHRLLDARHPDAALASLELDAGSGRRYLPGPAGAFVASERGLHDAHDLGLARALPVALQALHPRRAIGYGFAGSELVAVDAGSGAIVARRRLAKEDVPRGPLPFLGVGRGDRPRPRARVLVDARRQRLLIAFADRVVRVDLDELAPPVPAPPWLAARVSAPRVLHSGEEASLEVVTAEAVDVTLAAGPPGLRLGDGRLSWRPGAGDVGVHEVSLRLRGAEGERLQRLDLTVRRPAIELGMTPRTLAVAGDGSAVVAADGRTVVVVDHASRAVLARRGLSEPVRRVAIAGDQVFVAVGGRRGFLVLRTADLSEVKRVLTDQDIEQLIPSDGVLLTRGVAGGADAFHLPEVAPARADVARAILASARAAHGAPPAPLASGHAIGGVVFAPGLDAIQLLSEAAGVADVRAPAAVTARRLSRWDRYLDGGVVYDAARRVLGSFGGPVEIVPGAPALVQLTETAPARATSRSHRAVALEVRDLRQLGVAERVMFVDEPRPPAAGQPHLAAGGTVVAAAIAEQLYLVDVADVSGLRAPLRYELRADRNVLDPGATAELRHPVAGAEGDVSHSLADPYPGMAIDADAGVVTVEGPRLARAVEIALAERAARDWSRGRAITDALVSYREEAVEAFERLTGRAPQGLPVAVPITLRARDTSGAEASLTYRVLLEVDAAIVRRLALQASTDRAAAAGRLARRR